MDNNSVSWALRLTDFASDTLKKFGGHARDVFGGVDKEVDRVQRGMRDLGKPVVLQVDSSALRHAQSQIEGVHARMGFLATSGAMFVGNMAAQGVQRAISFAEQQIGDVMKGGKEAGAYKSDFSAISGSAGLELFDELRKYVKDSPFGTEQYGLAAEMLNYGVAVKEILPDLKMFADITGLNVEKLKLLEYAFSQMTSVGYLEGQDRRQMTGAGFDPILQLKRMTGKSTADLLKMMSDHQISAEMVRGAFVSATSPGGRFYGRLAGLTNTAAGREAAQLGSIEDAKMGLGESLMPAYSQLLNETQPLVDELPKMLAELKPEIEGIVKGMADMVKWTRTHTETLGKWVGWVKLGVEAWAAWKIGTVAMTAANWLWVQSVGAQTVQTTAATVALNEENVAILAQTEELAVLRNAWAMMGAEQKAFMATAATNTTILNAGTSAIGTAAARNASAGAAGLAGGFAAGASKMLLTVGIAYFAGEALQQLGKSIWGRDFQDIIGYDKEGNELSIWDVPGRMDARKRDIHKRLADEERARNPVQVGIGWSATGMLGGAGLNSGLLAKYGVKAPDGTAGAGSAGMSEMSDAILGGGHKVVNIRFDSFVRELNNNVNSKEEGQNWTVQELKVMLNQLLAGLPR